MRLSRLVIVVLFLVSSSVFAQHSSPGSSGGSSHTGSSSSFASSSGSHGGTSGGSSSASHSSGSHNSGGSVLHGSAAQAANSSGSQNGLNIRFVTAQSSTSSRTQTEKRGFFSALRHPFRKPVPPVEADLRRPFCRKEPCIVPLPSLCPPGQSINGKGVCASNASYSTCQAGNSWGTGSSCIYPLDDCRGLTFDSESTQLESLRRKYQRCQALQRLFAAYSASSYGSSVIFP